MRDGTESIEDSVFAAMLDKAENDNEAPPMNLVRHQSGDNFSKTRNTNKNQLQAFKSNFADMRKFSEPIHYSQYNDEPMFYLHANQSQMLSVTPRN